MHMGSRRVFYKNKKIALYLDDWHTPNCYSDAVDPPQKSGVYLIVKYDGLFEHGKPNMEIIYVGSSRNLSSRLRSHEVYKIARALLPEAHINYFFHETDCFKEYEKELIQKISPSINVMFNGGNKNE